MMNWENILKSSRAFQDDGRKPKRLSLDDLFDRVNRWFSEGVRFKEDITFREFKRQVRDGFPDYFHDGDVSKFMQSQMLENLFNHHMNKRE